MERELEERLGRSQRVAAVSRHAHLRASSSNAAAAAQEEELSSVVDAARAALGRENAFFALIDATTHEVICSVFAEGAGTARGSESAPHNLQLLRRGAKTPVSMTTCAQLVADADAQRVAAGAGSREEETPSLYLRHHEHAALQYLNADEYLGVPVYDPQTREAIGTLCVLNSTAWTQERGQNQNPQRDAQLLRRFGSLLESQVRMRERLVASTATIRGDVAALQREKRLAEARRGLQSGFAEMKMSELIKLAADLEVTGAEDVDSRAELVALLSSRLRAISGEAAVPASESAPAPDYTKLKFGQLLDLCRARSLAGAEDLESKAELIALLTRDDAARRMGAGKNPVAAAAAKAPAAASPSKGSLHEFKPIQSAGLGPWIRPEDVAARPGHLPWREHIESAVYRGQMPFPQVPVPIRDDDPERVAVARRYGCLDPFTAPDPFLNGLCATAKEIFNAFVVVINILGDEMTIEFASNVENSPLRAGPRSANMCNYAIYARQPVLIQGDEALRFTYGLGRFTLSVPLIDPTSGHAIGTLCMAAIEEKPNFGEAQLNQFSVMAESVMKHLELRALRLEHARLTEKRADLEESLRAAKVEKAGAPAGDAATAYVFTDIENSTVLWETHPQAMNDAQHQHDVTMRSLIATHHGHEVTTEGDAFFVAFHTAADALRFAVHAQNQMAAARESGGPEWPQELLADERAADTHDGVWRGPRVRMGIHVGPAERNDHRVAGHASYEGPAVRTARWVADAAHGGQVLVSGAAWAAARMSSALPLHTIPFHLGEHILAKPGKSGAPSLSNDPAPEAIIQVVPEQGAIKERDFSTRPPRTPRKAGPSYFDAPIAGGAEVVIAFAVTTRSDDLRLDEGTDLIPATEGGLATSGAGRLYSLAMEALHKLLRTELAAHGGYLCQEDGGTFMIAFASRVDALRFGAQIHGALRRAAAEGGWPAPILRRPLFQHGVQLAVGMFPGVPEEKRPHPATGRADYFGVLCNRAARVAYAANAGQTLAPSQIGSVADSVSDVILRPAGRHAFKGIPQLVDLVEVSPAIDGVAIDSAPPVPPLSCIARADRMAAVVLAPGGRKMVAGLLGIEPASFISNASIGIAAPDALPPVS